MVYPNFEYVINSYYTIRECPICDYSRGEVNPNIHQDIFRILCGRCGKFDMAKVHIEDDILRRYKNNSAKISGYIRLINETNKTPPLITSESIDKILADPMLPKDDDIEKKAEFLLDRLKEKTQYFGKSVELKNEEDYSLAFAKNVEEFNALLKFLEESNFLTIINNPSLVKLTAKGWKYFQDNSERSKSKNIFIASWFGPSMDESIKAISEIIEKYKFEPICIKDEFFKERIMDKALGEIKNSRFIIVDLTNHRPAVLFEAGFAHALGIDMIFVHKKDDKDHLSASFYTSHYQIHEYNDIEELKKKLDDVIKVRTN